MEEKNLDQLLETMFRREKQVVITEDAEGNTNIRLNQPEPFVIPTVGDALIALMAGCVRMGALSRAVCREVLEGMPEALEQKIENMDGTRTVMMKRKESVE